MSEWDSLYLSVLAYKKSLAVRYVMPNLSCRGRRVGIILSLLTLLKNYRGADYLKRRGAISFRLRRQVRNSCAVPGET